MKVSYAFLSKQFENPDPILREVKKLVKQGDFTLGPRVEEFERRFAKIHETKYAVGVSSGTDALLLIFRALGIGPGDEVITVPNSFFATAASIANVGAKIVFVDVDDEYNMDVTKIEPAITKRTKAILPVHWTGNPADMPAINKIAKKHKLFVIEDAAQAVDAEINGKKVGGFGIAAEFSLHPIKNYNVWGDGGVITTDKEWIAQKIKMLRNHGLKSRDECEFWGYCSRLHSLQALVGTQLMPLIRSVNDARIRVAAKYDKLLSSVHEITIPPRRKNFRQVYHTYILQAQDRDALVAHLVKNGVEAKVHYPIPLHLQKAARGLGYKRGDFPICEKQAEHIFSLPIHQFLTDREIEYVCSTISKFYRRRNAKKSKK